MNKQELIKEYENKLKDVQLKFGANFKTKVYEELLEDFKQLDESQPIELKDVIVRIKQLDIGTRKVWLDEILNELGSDYGTLKYKDGYEQGKFDGSMEHEKVTVPQFVADYIKDAKYYEWDLDDAFDHIAEESEESEIYEWFYTLGNIDVFARAWLDGYKIAEGTKYKVSMKGVSPNSCMLKYYHDTERWIMGASMHFNDARLYHTKRELEAGGFGEVFSSPLFEVEEVEE